MKKSIIQGMLIFVVIIFVAAFSACGKSQEELQKEKESIDRALKGGWIAKGEADSDVFQQLYGSPYYGVMFDNGKYEFVTLAEKDNTVVHSEEGTYTIYIDSKEIVCTTKDGPVQQRTFSYSYDGNNLTLTSANLEYKRMN